MGDAHGALLMFAVCSVGALAISAGSGGGVDAVYGGYFGLMAFVSGLLDLNLAIEHIVVSEWRQWHHRTLVKGDLSGIAKPCTYLVCSFVQLSSAGIAYLLYKEADGWDELEAEEPFFASHDQARVYNAVLSHSGERQLQIHSRHNSSVESDVKAFCGTVHKLPP